MHRFTLAISIAIPLFIALSASAAFADPALPIRVAIGGSDAAPFVSDTGLTNLAQTGADSIYTSTDTIDTSKAKNPAPKAVYQTERFGSDMTFTFSALTPKEAYMVRLHFVENCLTGAGQRIFDVLINKNAVLTQFDIYGDAGGKDIATVKTFPTSADDTGKIAIEATSTRTGGTDNALLNAVEILPAGSN